MKKITWNSLIAVCITSVLLFMLMETTGCKTTSPLGNAVGSQPTVTDYKAAGEAVGNAGYYAYAFLKQDPKYEKYT